MDLYDMINIIQPLEMMITTLNAKDKTRINFLDESITINTDET